MTSQQKRVEKAVELALAGATVLTANTRAARTLRREAEWRVLQAKPVCATPDVLPLTAWVSRSWTDCLLAGAVDRALIQRNVVAALWEQIIANSPTGRQMMSHHAAAKTALDAWKLLHEYKLPRNRAAFSGTAETAAFHEWMEAFEERCRRSGWIDDTSALTSLIAICGRLPNLPRTVVAFGFDTFSPLETDLWQAFRKCGVDVLLLSAGSESPHKHVRVTRYTDSKAEFRAAALWSRKQLEANPRARIGVLVPDLQERRAEVESIFLEHLHPEADLLANAEAERCFDISLGHPLGDHPMVKAALRLLRLLTSSLPASEFSLLLRSPYLGGGTSESNARARADVALRKKLRATVSPSQLLSGELRERLAIAPVFYRLLQTSSRSAAKLAARTTRSELAAEIRRLLTATQWPGDGPGELTLSSSEFQVTSAWDSLLSDFGALDQVLPTRAVSELLSELQRAASETTFATENEAAPIQIVGPVAASGESFSGLRMCGLTDENWPQRRSANPFIPFALQESAGLPQASIAANVQHAEQITARVLQSGEECVLSWPEREEDRKLRPSPMLDGIAPLEATLFDDDFVTYAERQDGAALEAFADELAPALQDDLQSGTKLLEWQSGCPFRAYAQVRLAAEPLDEPSLGANPRDRGKLTDLAMQHVWEQFRSLSDLQTLTEAQVEQGIATAVERALDEEFLKGEETWLAPHRELERARLASLIKEWLDLERLRANFTANQSQVELKLQFDHLTISGRADRIDQVDGRDVVIDYKTGGTKHSSQWWQPPRPRDPQLPIYAVALQRGGRELAGVAFARMRIRDCGFSDEAISKDIFGKGNFKRYGEFTQTVQGWEAELNQLAANFLAGRAEVDPNHGTLGAKSACLHCHLQALCRIAEYPAVDPEEEEDVNGE
jgi:ATP-dependent helicase/nuclease subunit B